MGIYDIIAKKRRGEELTDEEIAFFVRGYTEDMIPDYQISALLMAICINGMNDRETACLTSEIAASGDRIDLDEFGSMTVDKHSTGGVGDKTTLIIAPIVAALGCKVAKMSGRGLGHTGGTIDKLESIPGYRTTLDPSEFRELVRRIGVSVIGQSGNLAPADKKLYALRDVTATVDSIPLITSSIMGKKIAAGSHSILLDVKCGSGAFMKTEESAKELAELMVKIGKSCGRSTAAVITDMDTPLGYAIGNSLEVIEAIKVLRDGGPEDLRAVSFELAALMLHLTLGTPIEEARRDVAECVRCGAAFKTFLEWIGAQGADVRFAEDTRLFARASHSRKINAPRCGYISHMNAEGVGTASVALGAGRTKKDAPIDHAAGIILKKKTGEKIYTGDTVAVLYAESEELLDNAERIFTSSVSYSDKPVERAKLIYGTVT